MPEHTQSVPDQRRERVRRAIIFLLLALVLLLLALLVFSTATPEWNADGSRDAYPAWARALLCASAIAGTMLMPISVRAFLLAVLPSKTLGIVLGIFVGLFGVIAVPLELWLSLGITDAEDPGARERYENSEDWDWD